MFVLYTRLTYRRSHYWTTCGWSDRAANARRYRTRAEAKCVYERMARDGVDARIAEI